ncbi:transcriptional repressor DicA [uncultured Clostridium sp.]|nr:transcriptional repressor DicA [uncultured Clostridium sp.]
MEQIKTGKFIAELRKEKGMTQEQLGDRLGVNSRSVSRWENGHGMPDISLLLELADVLGVTVQELLEGSRREIESGNAGVVTYEGLHTVVQYLNQERAAWKKQIDSSLKFSLLCVGTAMVLYIVFELWFAYMGKAGAGLNAGVSSLLLIGFIRILQCQRMNKDEYEFTTEQLESLMENQCPKMHTAQEMLYFLKSRQQPEPDESKCEKILKAIETELKSGEAVEAVTQYGEYTRNALPMMWHPVIAFTDHRMIIGGERQKGMLMVEYDTESYEKDDILSNRTECDGIQWEMIIGTKQAELRFTIKKKRQSQKDREKTSEK